MKKILKLLLFCCFFLNSFSFFAQTSQAYDDYLTSETIRIGKAQKTEVLIEAYIKLQLKTYELSPAGLAIINEYFLDNDKKEKQKDVILLTMLAELRAKYFEMNAGKREDYTAAVVPSTLGLSCFNNGFEETNALSAGYSFSSLLSGNTVRNSCGTFATPEEIVNPITPNLNDFYANVSVVDKTEIPFDLTLNQNNRKVNGEFINMPTVSPDGDSHSIKLNRSFFIGTIATSNVITMKKVIGVVGSKDTSLSYDFSLLLGDTSGTDEIPPFFSVRLIVDGNPQLIRCINQTNCNFNRSFGSIENGKPQTYHDILYTGWRHDIIDVTSFRGSNVTLEFTIGNCQGGGHIATVYIDNISNSNCANNKSSLETYSDNCCESELTLKSPLDDINNDDEIDDFSHRKSSDWIKASNHITAGNNNTGDGVVYRAQEYIELLPNSGNSPGFETDLNSQFSAYIENCSVANNTYTYRKGKHVKSTSDVKSEEDAIDLTRNKIIIYPNPTNGYFTVHYTNEKFNKVIINSLDGRMVYNQKIEMTNSCQLDISAFSGGTYTLSIETVDGTVITEKLIKN